MKYAPLTIDPDTNNIKGLKMPDLSMCASLNCHNSGLCRRSPDSGTKPQANTSWVDFLPKDTKKTCQAYYPLDGARSK